MRSNSDMLEKFSLSKKTIISSLLFLILSWCMSDSDNEIVDGKAIRNTPEFLQEVKKIDSLKNITIDSLKTIIKNQQSTIDATKWNNIIQWNLLQEPKIKAVNHKDYIDKNKQTIPLSDLVKKLQKKVLEGNKILLDWSPEHILFKDSLILFQLFNEKNNIWETVIDNMSKNDYVANDTPLNDKQEKTLYAWFLKYIETKNTWKKIERESSIRNSKIHTEKKGNITVYYTDLDKKNPWVIAKHPTIQPVNYNYLRRSSDPYNTADYYSLYYKEPKQKIITISKEIFANYGIYNPKEIHNIIKTINTWKPFHEKNKTIPKSDIKKITKDSIIEKQSSNLTVPYTQYYKIKKNWHSLLQIKDYGAFDNDKIDIDSKEYNLSKESIDINLNTIIWSKVIIKILNEWMTPPNTLMLHLWSYQQKIEWKIWEIIVLDFE